MLTRSALPIHVAGQSHSNFVNNLFASACVSRRPTISFASGSAGFDDDGDLLVVAIDKPVEWHR